MPKTKKVPFKDRPICSCGVKMKHQKITTYYHDLYIWTCDNCSLEEKITVYEPDIEIKLGYG